MDTADEDMKANWNIRKDEANAKKNEQEFMMTEGEIYVNHEGREVACII